MAMKNILISTVAALSIIGTSAAADNKFSLNVATGNSGMTAAMIPSVVEGFEKRGFDINATMAGDCVNSKRLFEGSDEPTVAFWSNIDISSNELCDIGFPSESNFLNMVWHAPEYFCAKDDPVAALNENSTKIGIPLELPDAFVNALEKHNPKLKIVRYTSSGDMENAIVANEIDALISTRGPIMQKNGLVSCKYVTDTGADSEHDSLGEAIGDESLNYAYALYAHVVNVDPEMKNDIREAFQEILSSEEDVFKWFENYNVSPGIQFEDVKTQMNFLESLVQTE